MPLSNATKGGITGHLTDRIHAVREQQSAGAAPSRGGGGLGTGMASTDDDHVEVPSPGSRAVGAELGQRKGMFAEGRGDAAAAASD